MLKLSDWLYRTQVITKYLKNFKKITRIAIQKEWLNKDPFVNIRFRLDPVERDFLEKYEIEKIYKKKITIERLEQVRDIFIFYSFTGLAFSDVKQLAADHISIDVNGNKWIRKPRQKTKTCTIYRVAGCLIGLRISMNCRKTIYPNLRITRVC
jgi:hypothetical protein